MSVFTPKRASLPAVPSCVRFGSSFVLVLAAAIALPAQTSRLADPSQLTETAPDVYRARVLIMEITFAAPGHRREKIHKYGHIHLDDVVERADRFENELIIASHVSTRYHDDQVRRLVHEPGS